MQGGRLFISEDKKTLAMLINKGSENIFCDDKPMKQLTANTTDAAQEKHVPVVEIEKTANFKKVSIKVGSVPHPMTAEHLIAWIYLQTKKGGHYYHLTPADKPEAVFFVAEDDEPIAAYEYCNLHGLWKADIAQKSS